MEGGNEDAGDAVDCSLSLKPGLRLRTRREEKARTLSSQDVPPLSDVLEPIHWLATARLQATNDQLSSNVFQGVSELSLLISNDNLQEAALRGDVGLLVRLMQAGTSVNMPVKQIFDDEYVTLLHLLVCRPCLPNGMRVIQEILKFEGNVNARSSFGSTPLMFACTNKHVAATDVLLRCGAETFHVDDLDHTAVCCAVRLENTSNAIENETQREASVKILKLLARHRADLNRIGGRTPLGTAILSNNTEGFTALLNLGAIPVGLHEAAVSAPLAMIKELIQAEANPFLEDSQGNTPMEYALKRGDMEILTLMRDFIGDLERAHHTHLLTRKKSNAEQKHSRKLPSRHRMSRNRPEDYEVHTRRHRHVHRVQEACKWIVRRPVFELLMFAVLLCALYLPSIWIIFDGETLIVDLILVGMLALFVFEWLMNVIGFDAVYLKSGSCWLDLFCIVSMPLDLSYVNTLIVSNIDMDNVLLKRLAVVAKLGARSGRGLKLLKLRRYIPCMSQPHSTANTAKGISQALNTALLTRITCLIVVLVMILPVFGYVNHPRSDYSMESWVHILDWTWRTHPEEISEKIADMARAYNDLNVNYHPIEVILRRADSTAEVRKIAEAPKRDQDRREVTIGQDKTSVVFDFWEPRKADAISTLALTTTVIVIIFVAGAVVFRSVSAIVLKPLDNLLSVVQAVAGKIFHSVHHMMKDFKEDDDSSHDEDFLGYGATENETLILEKVLTKLTALGEMALKASPVDPAALDKLGEAERGLMLDYTLGAMNRQDFPDTGPQNEKWQAEVGAAWDEEHETEMYETLGIYLQEEKLKLEDFSHLELDILNCSEAQCHHVAHALLQLYGSCMNVYNGGQSDLPHLIDAFVSTVFKGYGSREKVPYHNKRHGVDVCFTLHYIFSLCRAESFTSRYEEFALIVSALCHDIGHPAFSNAFLVETQHDLARVYNDQSPLEMMHASVMFSILARPTCAVFEVFSKTDLRLIRKVCIEAIMFTDNQRHFSLVNELQVQCDMHPEVMEASAATRTSAFNAVGYTPSTVEFFHSPDMRRVLTWLWLHLCDVANPAKPWKLCEVWAGLVVEEFLTQGDREKELGIPVSPLNDRDKVNPPYSQIGFIEFFVAPLVSLVCKVMPGMAIMEDALRTNLDHWSQKWLDGLSDPAEKAAAQDRVAKVKQRVRKEMRFQQT